MVTKKALVIDDSPPTRKMMSMFLEKAGFTVHTSGDGSEGAMKLNDTSQFYSLIITDLNMPKMNGVEFLKMARGQVRYKKTPIMVVTTDFRKDQQSSCMTAGATDVMIKPFTEDEFIGKVKRIC